MENGTFELFVLGHCNDCFGYLDTYVNLFKLRPVFKVKKLSRRFYLLTENMTVMF